MSGPPSVHRPPNASTRLEDVLGGLYGDELRGRRGLRDGRPLRPQLCTAGYACATGTTCGASSTPQADAHGCVPTSCAQGYGCAPNTQCVPGAANGGGDGHDCVPFSCKVDVDCPCGVCVLESCELTPGICVALLV